MSSASTTHAFFMLTRATRAWLAMPPGERLAFIETTLAPILARHPAVKLRYFDTEAFSARVSDLLLWETTAIPEYLEMIDQLRDTAFWDGYFEVIDIIPGIENAYTAARQGVPPIGE